MGNRVFIEFFKHKDINATFTIKEVMRVTYSSYSVTNATLQHLIKRGIIKRVSKGKGRGRGKGREYTKYRLSDFGKRWVQYKLGRRSNVSRRFIV